MQREGIVRIIDGENAVVVIKRETACGDNCANCGGCSEKSNEVKALNNIGAKQGDTVVVEMEDKTVILAAFKVYIIPLMIFFAGFILFSCFEFKELICAFFCFLLVIVFYIILHFKDKNEKNRYIHKIVQIKTSL